MNKNVFLLFVTLTSFIVLSYSQNIPPEIVDLAVSFLENPSDLFFNLQQNIEDNSPLKNKYFGIRTNLFPTLLPTTLGNLSIKVRFNNETDYIPQIGLAGGYGKMFVLDLIPSDTKPENRNIFASIILSKTFNDHIIFGGLKYSESLLKINFPEPIEFIPGSTMSEINFKMNDIFWYTGILANVSKKKSIVAQMAYSPKYKKIVARLGADYNNLELGFDFFPEGMFVFHPYWAYHWRF